MAISVEGESLPRQRQPTDIEAAIDLAKHPTASGSCSSAKQLPRPNDPSYLRHKAKGKAKGKATSQTTSWRAPAIFNEIQQHLEDPTRQNCLFLCWENGDKDQRAVPLLIEDPEDEKRIYQDLHPMWYERCGWWWKYFPFYGVLSLEEVKV